MVPQWQVLPDVCTNTSLKVSARLENGATSTVNMWYPLCFDHKTTVTSVLKKKSTCSVDNLCCSYSMYGSCVDDCYTSKMSLLYVLHRHSSIFSCPLSFSFLWLSGKSGSCRPYNVSSIWPSRCLLLRQTQQNYLYWITLAESGPGPSISWKSDSLPLCEDF